MLSKKRPILFDVLGDQRQRAARGPERQRAVPRREAIAAGRPAWFLGLALVAVGAVIFVVWRTTRSDRTDPPVLQTNTVDSGTAPVRPDPPPAHTFTVCALERPYKNLRERKLAAERVQDLVDFCYHAGPEFRDVVGDDHKGREPNTGTFRIYVGSARSRTELVALKDKLTALRWKDTRPFQNASFRMIERAGSPGAKESSNER
jgi:hypothetical protein